MSEGLKAKSDKDDSCAVAVHIPILDRLISELKKDKYTQILLHCLASFDFCCDERISCFALNKVQLTKKFKTHNLRLQNDESTQTSRAECKPQKEDHLALALKKLQLTRKFKELELRAPECGKIESIQTSRAERKPQSKDYLRVGRMSRPDAPVQAARSCSLRKYDRFISFRTPAVQTSNLKCSPDARRL